MPNYKRIMIIGGAGAGKTTLANILGEKLNIPVTHLDKIYWLPNWQRPDELAWINIMNGVLSNDTWIIDGTYENTLKMRLAKADLVIYLNINRFTRINRIIRRINRTNHHKEIRDDLATGCKEKLDLKFIKWAWNFKRLYEPLIKKDLIKYSSIPLYEIKNKKQMENLIKYLTNEMEK